MRVLLVDDEVAFAGAVARSLELDGFAVDVAHNGIDGLHAGSENEYDVIVLDVMLPGHSGYEVLRTLRSRRVWAPVLMLTAKDGEWDIADALDLGADDYLVKPFAHVVLVARLRALLRRGARPRPATLKVGALELDPGTRQLLLRGKTVSLTSKELALVEYLARNAHRVVSKIELLDHVWGEAVAGDVNLVEVHVASIRRKLGAAAIETRRGEGYRLSADA